MATPDLGSIPKETLREVTPGIEQPEDSIADAICQRRTDVTALKGTAPFQAHEMTMRRGLNRDLAPGQEPKSERGGMGEVEYHAKRQVGKAEIYDESEIQAAAFNLDIVEAWTKEARKDANTAVDLKFADVLASATLNQEFDVTNAGNGAWTDQANATPLQDMVDMSDLVPHADTAVVGRGVVSALRKHPETMGEVINYTGGGVMGPDHIRAAIAKIFDISEDRVWLLTDRLFNDAALGEDYKLGFVASDVFWVGAGYDLQLFDPNHERNRESEVGRVLATKTELAYKRFVDIKRVHEENAITATNTV